MSVHTDLVELVARLEEAGIIRLSREILSLALHVAPSQAGRDEYLHFLQEARIHEPEEYSKVPMSETKPEAKATGYRRLLDDSMSGRSLGEIYQHIPSPLPLEAPTPEGVKTDMFRYQLRSVHRMLEREGKPEIVKSDYWIPIKTDAGHLFLHPTTLELRREIETTNRATDARGGILSEEMGVGKTLEILSLILSTRGLLPLSAVEDEMASAVTTALALDWPHQEWHGLDPVSKKSIALERIPYYSTQVEEQGKPLKERDQVGHPFDKAQLSLQRKKLPSLRDMCAHKIRMSGSSIAPEQYSNEEQQFHIRAMKSLLKSATPFYHLWPPLRGHRTPRVEVVRMPVRVYLSAATIVVVPGTLLAQWQAEIAKHTKPDALRVLYLPHATSQIPSALELANDYDVILLSHARLGKEDKEGSLEWNWPSVPRQCKCPYLGSTRTIDCRCPSVQKYQPSDDMSPLLRCRFKRLCIDEGHVAAGDSDMVRMASKIKSECRWVISGTPTESLVGSNLYRSSSSSDFHRHRGVTSVERKDLERLRALLHDFLHVPLLLNWHSEFETPFKKGSVYSSTRLWKLLSRVMVRNQAKDVEQDSPLPPLKDEVVKLDFTRLERATFNVLQSLILLNAVWSQREDDDYFFHHSNRKHLAAIMENLSLSCFHFAGSDLCEQAREALIHARKQLEKKGKWSENDRSEAEMAIHHLQMALDDDCWVNRGADVVFRVAQLQAEVVGAWRRQISCFDFLQLSAEEAMAMQRAVGSVLQRQATGLLKDGEVGRTEELVTLGDIHRRSILQKQKKIDEEQSHQVSKSRKDRSEREHTSQAAEIGLLSSHRLSPSKRASPSKNRSNRKMSLLESTVRDYTTRRQLPGDSGLLLAHISGASSTKLVRLLQVLSTVPPDEKVIIFSNLDNVLYEVSTALDIACLPHFIYASGAGQEKRNEVIEAFRSEQTFVRLLLMKTNIGGRGLDLSCANHTVFLEPILDKSLRVQALKRTWRTGQKRPVHAVTFVIRDTFEEDVLRLSETANTYKLSEDPSMRAVVSNPTFITSSSMDVDRSILPCIVLFPGRESKEEEKSEVPLPTPPISPETAIFQRKSWKFKRESEADQTLEAKVKRRKVTFA
ncbi:hypothetical protein CBS101457_006434 [Exobasidium rhododendri]|nr:hypothetical protein CBS101457_006434 [Exobasidium rhododendri]